MNFDRTFFNKKTTYSLPYRISTRTFLHKVGGGA
ncbi:unknown [[Mannheimia] succiniciproducens MBEL55E]|uniref:Uncharacterized protein n=1 Tax=Mannheimia succiniciproducens (strain KCTC 0769BP / MBEL55E) TaxID=221988 RepID=Q65RF0_MANSM|nr:unknown [[Mannheimia] succiniciproducens MBEL55E]